ncbi:Vacuolar protein sorting-associated protein 62 [Quillaja saponaria]|uniref:Vacuolar protein sorting-associated protein 62 n=1 Tax=Quillaja saponaria TaxID=32244 RepID=A0AAD7VNA4_QUISA|nr:Vacuolar protein sorting-associated protein 62 [Quillaja saponaria]
MSIFIGLICAAILSEIVAVELHQVLPTEQIPADVSKKSKIPPIETTFKLPSPIPSWPPGDGFASGIIDLGGLQVSQISSFNKVWATHEGGPDNLGATFFEPSKIPQGFFMLGCYSQPNNKALFGWVLVGKDDSSTNNGALKEPVEYTLVWSSESLKIKQDGNGYVWLPTAPDGYKAVGHVVTTTPEKPSLDRIRCVRSDLTDQGETDSWIWGPGQTSNANGFNVYNVRPSNRGTQAQGVIVGTFLAQIGGNSSPLSITCLKNTKPNSSSLPNLSQIEALVQAYSPFVYLHPDEEYHPSSVYWFFTNGGLLYKKGEETKPVPINTTGSNLPQGGSNDGAYWLDLPVDKANKERVKKGDLQSSQAYLHIKPMLGATFTDIAIWIFYPFNGPARAKVEFLNIPLGKIGEHVGDWEHVTLRVSNFNGELWRVYFSEHSSGAWVDASGLEFQNGNKPVAYSSLHGHAFYPKPGLVLQGNGGIGIRNDTAKSSMVVDTGAKFELVAAEYLASAINEPAWLNYFRKWGPKIDYSINDEIKKIEKILPGKLKKAFEDLVNGLPAEVLGEEGPTGPKVKNNWNGDEV